MELEKLVGVGEELARRARVVDAKFPLVPKTLFWYNIGGLFPWERIIGKRGH